MAIRIKHAEGPQEMPVLEQLLAGRKFTVEGDAAMCPHCFKYQPRFRGRRGVKKCGECSQTFFWEKRGPFAFLTSKTEITSGEIQE